MGEMIQITLLSDTCPAAGRGRDSEVDIEIEFDGLGLPVIGAKRIKSLIHEAWREMSPYFSGEEITGQQIFGIEGALELISTLNIDDAQLDDVTRGWVAWAVNREDRPLDPVDVLRTLTDIRDQTSEDRDSGAPSETTLRRTRVVRRGLILKAPISWIDTCDGKRIECLTKALKNVRHLGSNRNRGLGHVRLELTSQCSEESVDHQPDKRVAAASSPNSDEACPNGWRFIPVTFQLDAPVVLGAPGGDPNSASTYSHIPGSTLRGSLVQARLSDLVVDDDKFAELFLNDNVRFLNAYPIVNGTRSAPTHRSWRRRKDQPQPDDKEFSICDAVLAPEVLEDCVHVSEQFYGIECSRKVIFNTAVQERTHNARDPVKGRAWKDEKERTHGAVYSYQAIRGGQEFQGMLQVKESEAGRAAGDELVSLLNTVVLRMGRSKAAGYGARAKASCGPTRIREWNVLSSSRLPDVIAKDTTFLLLLTSPYLGRDPSTGQPDPGSLVSEVVYRLGKVKCVRAVVEVEVVGGFNRNWGLELPQFPAASAGSVLLLKATDHIEGWRAMENEGLGERRIEGFGRLVLLPAPSGDLTLDLKQPDQVVPPSSTPVDLLIMMQRELLLQKARPFFETRAEEIAHKARNLPPNSLLGRLRTGARQDKSDNLDDFKKLLDSLKEEGAKKLQRCRISTNDNLYIRATLRAVLDSLREAKGDDLVQRFGLQRLNGAARLLKKPEEHMPAIESRLRREFLDALLSALQKRNGWKEAQ